jgi:hypothetical protein
MRSWAEARAGSGGRRLGLLAVAVAVGPLLAGGQAGPPPLRIAFVSEWAVEQHRRVGGAPRPELGSALDRGVVDGLVFGWRRAVIPRQALVAKPVRVLSREEAAPLGGHGAFRLAALRRPAGAAAWTEVEVAPETAGPEDVLLLEVGGDHHTIEQVVETLLVGTPEGGWREPGLARRALIRGAGIPVVTAVFGRPLSRPDAAALFQAVGGAVRVECLVVRSPIDLDTIRNGAITGRGRADLSPVWARGGDWREGDRLYVRLPLAALRAGPPALVVGWKDRTTASEGGRDQWDPAE